MDNKEISTKSRDKYKNLPKLTQRPNKRDLRQRLKQKNIRSLANNSMIGVSPKSKIILKINKTQGIPQKRGKKMGMHVQSISFSKS